MSASKKIRTFLPKAKIKQMMQKDEDVGKISADVPIMISRGLELFLEQLVQQAHQIAANRGSKILSAQHLKACIVGSERFDFLSHLVENVSDLPAMTEAEMEKARAVAAVPPKKRKPAVEGESQTKKPKAKKNNKKVAGGAAEIVEQLQEESFVEIPNSMDEEVKDVRMHELPSFSNRFASDDEDQWNDEE